MQTRGSSSFHGLNAGSSFANGNGPGPGPDTMADWYAGRTDERILSHWWCR